MLVHPEGWALAHQVDRVISALEPGGSPRTSRPRRTCRRSSSPPACTRPPAARPRSCAAARARGRSIAPLGLLAAARAPTRSRSGTTRSSPPATASARSTARCASSRVASRPSRCTSTSGSPTRERRSSWPTACGPISRCCSRCRPTRRSGRAATPGWPRRARRSSRPSRAWGSLAPSAPTPSTSRPSTYSCAPEPSPSRPSCGGTCARSPGSARSRSASWTPRRPPRPPRRSSPLVQSLVRLEAEEGYASPRLLAQPEVLEENRFLAARDGVEAELVDPDEEALVPLRTVLSRAAPGPGPARRGARLRRGARRRRGAGRVPLGPTPARRVARAGPPARPGQAPGQGLRALPGAVGDRPLRRVLRLRGQASRATGSAGSARAPRA